MIRAYDDYGNVVDTVEWEKQIRADAERDFQNSDYWNDYLAKVIADAKKDAINEFVTRFEAEYSRMAVHLGEFRKYQFEMHRLAEEMLKEQKHE